MSIILKTQLTQEFNVILSWFTNDLWKNIAVAKAKLRSYVGNYFTYNMSKATYLAIY